MLFRSMALFGVATLLFACDGKDPECAADEVLNEETGECEQALQCDGDQIPNAAGSACVCPEGEEDLGGGVCDAPCDSGLVRADSGIACLVECPSGDLVNTPDECSFRPFYLRISGQFATDGTAVAESFFTAADDSRVDIDNFHETLYGNAQWNETADDIENYCVVILPFLPASPFRSEVLADADLWVGFNFDGTVENGAAFTNCYEEGYGLSEADWGTEADFVATHTGSPMYMVLGEFTQAVGDAVEAAEQANGTDLPFVGAFISSGYNLPVNGVQTQNIEGYAEGLQFNPDSVELLVEEDGTFANIPDTDVWDGANLTPGLYFVTSFWSWTFSQ